MIIHYEEVLLKATKRGKCQCGKRVIRTKKFSQTINPYNRINGIPKTRNEILKELQAECDTWMANSKVHCSVPSYWEWTREQRDEYDKNGEIVIRAKCGTEVIIRCEACKKAEVK